MKTLSIIFNNGRNVLGKGAILLSFVTMVSCNSFLDEEPITSVSTNSYLYAESDLAAYAANLYTSLLPSHGNGYNMLGLFDDDNGTDCQTANQPSTLFVTGQYRVGDNSLWSTYMSQLRSVNFFLQSVPARYASKEISGNDDNVKHYIGEMYFFRAMIYFNALKNLGDFPILTRTVGEGYEEVRTASERRPRNEVARFIIADLDTAYTLMKEKAPMSNRLNKDCAALLKSRVALFEGTWEKYHKGTAFVPGGSGWPGATMDYLKSYKVDIDNEVSYFLGQAVQAAEIVADKHSLYKDYAAMFNSVDLSGMGEILLWRKYSISSDATSTHFVVNYLQRNGAGNSGFTRSMVDSYLMSNGLPIYANGSGYQGDDTYAHLFASRDPRMDQTILKTGDLLSVGPNLVDYIKASDGYGYFYRAPLFEGQVENSNPTGYCLRKGLNTSAEMQCTKESYTGCPTFRAAEAYLNYIEAYYELHHNLGGKCDTYWKAIRARAGVSTDYKATIDNTDMQRESADWGSYSAGKLVDATTYNIRRERKIELAAEGFRLADLKRWRSLDQVQDVQIQGCNFWTSIYQLYTNPQLEDAATPLDVVKLIPYGSGTASNVSAKDDPAAESKYLLPYRKNAANIGFNGLNWNKAMYLYPIRSNEFRLTTQEAGSNDLTTSSIYQNPGWSTEDGTLPE
jgi:hypothetical protein